MSDDEVLSGSQNHDYNLIELDQIIKKKLSEKSHTDLPKYKLQLKELHQKKKSGEIMTMIQAKTLEMDIDSLKKKIEALAGLKDLEKYIEASEPILEKYRILGPSHSTFLPGESTERSATVRYRNGLINLYLTIAEKYIPIRIISRKPSIIQACNECGEDLEKNGIQESGYIICSLCGYEQEYNKEIMDKGSDSSRKSKNDYENRAIFIRTLKRYQGKIPVDFPDSLYVKLNKYMTKNGFPTSKDAELLPINKMGEKKDTSVSILLGALKAVGHPAYYKDVHLLAHRYWGWRLDDLSAIEDKIMEKYDQSQPLYLKYKDPHKTSSMNAQYRLCWHCWDAGHRRPPSRFKILKTQDIITEYERTREAICNELGWDWISMKEMEHKIKDQFE